MECSVLAWLTEYSMNSLLSLISIFTYPFNRQAAAFITFQ